MKTNQRYHNTGKDLREKIVKSKVYENYKNHIDHLIQDSSRSFDSIETPGWTSLVGTQQSKSTHINKKFQPKGHQDTHIQILNRLNSLPKLTKNQGNYSNIRLNPSITKNKNVFVYGSVNTQQKRINETPRSKQVRQSPRQSSKASNKSNKYPINGGTFKRPQIFFTVSKNSQRQIKQSSRKRTSSVRSQPRSNLKDRIKERLSVGNYKQKNVTPDFQSNIKTEPNDNTHIHTKPQQTTKFYSQIHSFYPIKEQKNEYLNRYLNKLNQRTRSSSGVKIFKKPNLTNTKQDRNQNVPSQSPSTANENILPLTLKRFNTITVHDHLYQNGLRLESKKKMLQMVEDSYQKATTLTFSPFVSEKSNVLAQSKFSKQGNALFTNEPNNSHGYDSCFIKKKKDQKSLKSGFFTIQQQVATEQKSKITQKLQTRTLIKLFEILSNKSQVIDDRKLQVNIQKLPLSMLELLEPILTQIYKKRTFNEKQFLELFSLKSFESKGIPQIMSKKPLIIAQTQRLIIMLERIQNKDKENNVGSMNTLQKTESKFFKE